MGKLRKKWLVEGGFLKSGKCNISINRADVKKWVFSPFFGVESSYMFAEIFKLFGTC